MSPSKIEKLIAECRKHIIRLNSIRLNSASTKMSLFMPLDSNKYIPLTDNEVEHIIFK